MPFCAICPRHKTAYCDLVKTSQKSKFKIDLLAEKMRAVVTDLNEEVAAVGLFFHVSVIIFKLFVLYIQPYGFCLAGGKGYFCKVFKLLLFADFFIPDTLFY